MTNTDFKLVLATNMPGLILYIYFIFILFIDNYPYFFSQEEEGWGGEEDWENQDDGCRDGGIIWGGEVI